MPKFGELNEATKRELRKAAGVDALQVGRVSLLDFIPAAERAGILAGTSPYDCSGALSAAIASFGANASQYYSGGPCVYFAPGRYLFASAIQLKRTVTLRGDASGMAGGCAAKLVFPADSPGIVVNRYNTLGDTEQVPATTGADGSIIEGLWLHGGGGSVNPLNSGVRFRARATVRDCTITGFPGHGICISADTSVPASDPFHGNANNWRVDTARLVGNKAGGMFVSGGDANAGTAVGVDASSNGRFGFCDRSFLGNTYVGCHADSNGLYGIVGGMTEATVVSHNGNRYWLQDESLGATEPGTNAAAWAFYGEGGVHPQIPAWAAEGNYVRGGAYFLDGYANYSIFSGCYTEGGQAPAQIGQAGLVVGGYMGRGELTGAPHLRGSGIGLDSQRPYVQSWQYPDGSSTAHVFGGDIGPTPGIFSWGTSQALPNNPAARIALRQERASGDTFLDFYGITSPVRFNGYSTARLYGRSDATTNRYTTEVVGLVIGAATPGDGGRRHVSGTAAPTTGEWGRGDTIHNTTPSAGGWSGWICTTAGTPGTWKGFGAIEP